MQPGDAVSMRRPSLHQQWRKKHLAAWKECKARPVIRKPSTRQPGQSYAQEAANQKKKEEKTDEKEIEIKTDKVTDLADLKDPLQALKGVQMLLQEFPNLLEGA
ncbi:hypothetical protein AVEN_4291-1 [Araneus ventricosus]|uniref:Uncharacterized protein n=1 Tax=Araneus ventricosus TaxID=182803 RepID=A0A4Y2PJ80_ARAVE|nr:hypothetical protein AVEN_4291-1 [Araneus ventricosus]